jgi:NAD(P)-dependent dehydrogenase (short-subunit alcohol dehydrogenase family)
MILITGASEGIGFACARAILDRTTATVLITGRSAEKLERARARIPETDRGRLVTAVSDQAARSEVDALVGRIRASNEIDGAILTVGVNPLYTHGPTRFHALPPEVVEATITTNCTHTALVTGALLERFRARSGGALIWVGSRAAAIGFPGAAIYCATKAFLGGLARAAANEYASRGVRVHLVHPGVVRTPRTAALADQFAARHGVEVAEADSVAGRIVELLLAGGPEDMEVELC